MELRSSDPSAGGSPQLFAWFVGLFALAAILAIVDLVADSGEGSSAAHVATEASIATAAIVGASLAARHMVRLRTMATAATATAARLGQHLAATQADARRWRAEAQELLAGLGAAIERQFARWQLSAAETEIAQLLLKGLSHKEVAAARGVGEATVRQQARAVYQKAGVQGRHELAAFFLEGLLAPPGSDRD